MSSYIEKVLWSIAKTSFSKKAYCHILISLTSLIIRIHVDSIISFLLTTPYYYINFIIHIISSTFIVMNSKYIYDVVHRYEPEFYKLIKYLIENYTEKNYKKWKRKVNVYVCAYIYALTYVIEITNMTIRQIIIEYMICYFLLDTYYKYMEGKFTPQNKEYDYNTNEFDIIDDKKYDSELFDIKKS